MLEQVQGVVATSAPAPIAICWGLRQQNYFKTGMYYLRRKLITMFGAFSMQLTRMQFSAGKAHTIPYNL